MVDSDVRVLFFRDYTKPSSICLQVINIMPLSSNYQLSKPNRVNFFQVFKYLKLIHFNQTREPKKFDWHNIFLTIRRISTTSLDQYS